MSRAITAIPGAERLSAEQRNSMQGKGFRDRKVGAWGGWDEADLAEPARTERILRHPFAWRWNPSQTADERLVDGWHSREGFLMFRVNGRTSIVRARKRLEYPPRTSGALMPSGS